MTFREALADLLEQYGEGKFPAADLRADLKDALKAVQDGMKQYPIERDEAA